MGQVGDMAPVSRKPLAAAAERLRKKPGRPRKANSGHIAGTGDGKPRTSHGRKDGTPALTIDAQDGFPRLLDLESAGRYLSLSPWTVRSLIDNQTLPRVRIPLPHGGELRKVLLDREDLDQLIARWKDG